MFNLINVDIAKIDTIDFRKHPAFYQKDLNDISVSTQVDLITAFYVSKKMVLDMESFNVFKKLLKKDGIVLISTEAETAYVKSFLKNNINSFDFKVIEVPDNFEKTAVILRFKENNK